MADVEPSPDQQIAADNLNYAKQEAGQRLIVFLNGVTTNLLARYPIAEVQSWTIQRSEAVALEAAGAGAAVTMAPLLTKVCEFHYGPANGPTRLTQVLAKAQVVRGKSDAWEVVGAFVNGLRARTEDQLDAAQTPVEALEIIQGAMAEANAFRAQAGI